MGDAFPGAGNQARKGFSHLLPSSGSPRPPGPAPPRGSIRPFLTGGLGAANPRGPPPGAKKDPGGAPGAGWFPHPARRNPRPPLSPGSRVFAPRGPGPRGGGSRSPGPFPPGGTAGPGVGGFPGVPPPGGVLGFKRLLRGWEGFTPFWGVAQAARQWGPLTARVREKIGRQPGSATGNTSRLWGCFCPRIFTLIGPPLQGKGGSPFPGGA